MKNHIFFLMAIASSLSFFACTDAPEGENVEAGEAVENTSGAAADAINSYPVDTDASQIVWNASKVGGKHNGTIGISQGSLQINDGNIAGGEFIIDVNSITVLDLEGESKMKLEGHLRTGDFFEAETYPTGNFSITSVDAADTNDEGITHYINGNLTLKGAAKSVKLPAMVSMQDGRINATTLPFTINRTDWSINYGSGIIGTAKDKIIHDEVGLVINLVATAPAM